MGTTTANRSGPFSSHRVTPLLHQFSAGLFLLLLGITPAGAIPLSLNNSSPPGPQSTPEATSSPANGPRRPGRIVAGSSTPADSSTISGQRRPGGIPSASATNATTTSVGVTDAR